MMCSGLHPDKSSLLVRIVPNILSVLVFGEARHRERMSLLSSDLI